MWTREINYNNMVINDPKGELLVKFYVRGAVRGFQIIQFNLINVMNTDIYNALGLASESAREGDFTKCAQYVENIAEVFFPVDEMTDEEYNKKLAELEKQSKLLWEDKTDADMLTLFFNASNQLPRNQMRTLVRNADDALRSMGGAEKMMASVYGIAITAMVSRRSHVKSMCPA